MFPVTALSDCDIGYKIYFPFAYPYVFEKHLNNYKFNYNIEEKIQKLFNLKSIIKNTDLPLGIIKCEDNCVGCILKYYSNSPHIDELFDTCSINEIVNYYLQVNNKLKEMTDNNIYDLDAHDQNILINNNHVKLVDVDGIFMKIENVHNEKYYNEVFKKLNNTITQYIIYISRNNSEYIISNDDKKKIDEIPDFYYRNIELLNKMSKKEKIRVLR